MFDDDDFEFPFLPYVRGSETSEEAARRASPNAKTMAQRILTIIDGAGPDGLTTDQVNEILEPFGHGNQTVSPRVLDLLERGMITRGPDKRVTRANKRAYVSRAVRDAVENFDTYWHRPVVRKTPETRAYDRALRDVDKCFKRWVKLWRERSTEMPTR